jgi:hypothetical protein
MVVACLALAVALGGTSYAAVALPRNSVGTAQLKKNAVTSPKVKNNSITGADVRESSLAQVPSAGSARHAVTADHATSAGSSTTAGTANSAFSRYDGNNAITVPNTLNDPILALYIPGAGNYVITAKFTAVNGSSTATDVSCLLVAGTGQDYRDGAAVHVEPFQVEPVVLQLPSHFDNPGAAVLYCSDSGVGDAKATDTRITAIQVAQSSSTIN